MLKHYVIAVVQLVGNGGVIGRCFRRGLEEGLLTSYLLRTLASNVEEQIHVHYIITTASRMGAGEHPAGWTGTLVDSAPMPSPRTDVGMNRVVQVFATSSQMDEISVMK